MEKHTTLAQILMFHTPELSRVKVKYHLLGCGFLPDPSNGKVTYSNTAYLLLATYSCNIGYMFTESESRTCQADTTCSNDERSCDINLVFEPDKAELKHFYG